MTYSTRVILSLCVAGDTQRISVTASSVASHRIAARLLLEGWEVDLESSSPNQSFSQAGTNLRTNYHKHSAEFSVDTKIDCTISNVDT
jgi:hypothetical protein